MALDDLGFEVIDSLITTDEVQLLLAVLGELELEPLRGGIRRIEQRVSQVATLAQSTPLLSVAAQHLSGKPHLVRAIYFDKSPENNWFVTWHQDRTVAVSRRFEQAGWGPWSLKAEVWHVQPPMEVLNNMVTIRVHLDPATIDNGCLKIMPRSHRLGLLASDNVHTQINKDQAVYCETAAGGAVVMRPHVLHSSEKSVAATSRRVLHFEYSSYTLPEGVTWAA